MDIGSNDTTLHHSNNYNKNPLSAPFCQAVAKSAVPARGIPLFHITKEAKADHLSLAEVCRQTLERVWKEFEPIIRRRGYNVQSISELCCCGDGLDTARARALRKQPDTVWGYNQTTTVKRRTGNATSSSSTSHTIHLRLRQPRHHATQLLAWEDVAGTMAHELSHCVHQNHSKDFYQLMEQILDEHATVQLESMGSLIYGTNSATTNGVASTLPTSGGYRLGGNTSIEPRKSRLIDGGTGGGGYRLNPSSNGENSQTTPSPRARREAMARAAEKRKKQMEQFRRMIEASRVPCVIEILDDDDDDVDGKYHPYGGSTVNDKPTRAKPHAAAKKESPIQVLSPFTIKNDDSIVDMTASTTPRVTKRPKASTQQETTLDLTESPANTSASAAISSAAIANREWNCPRCTFHNRPSALVCTMCHEERNLYLHGRLVVDDVIAID